jgi:hypothetical protein
MGLDGDGFDEKKGLEAARSDDARSFGHNTAALAVLNTLKGYR